MIIQKTREDLFNEYSRKCRLVKVQLELTHRCNLRCIHCKIDDHTRAGDLSADDIRALLPELAKAGCFSVNLTGGEMLTRPDIVEVLEILFAHQFFYSMQTNATLMDDRIIDLLDANRGKIRTIALSLYAVDPAVHDAITTVPGSHARTMEAIRKLKERDLPVWALGILMEPNWDEAGKILRFCEANGVGYQFNALIVPQEGRGRKPLALRLSDEHLRNLPIPRETLVNMDSRFNPTCFGPDEPISSWCSMGRSSCYIESTGEVYPCSIVERPAGNVRERPFSEIWRDAEVFREIRAYRVRDFECAGCRLLPECLPCPGLAHAEHGDIFTSPREMCRISKTFLEGGKEREKAILQT